MELGSNLIRSIRRDRFILDFYPTVLRVYALENLLTCYYWKKCLTSAPFNCNLSKIMLAISRVMTLEKYTRDASFKFLSSFQTCKRTVFRYWALMRTTFWSTRPFVRSTWRGKKNPPSKESHHSRTHSSTASTERTSTLASTSLVRTHGWLRPSKGASKSRPSA